MNIQIFGTTKCFDTKKAQRYFKERKIKFQFINLKEKPMSKGEFQSVKQAVGGLDAMINGAGKDQDAVALIKYIAAAEKRSEGAGKSAGTDNTDCSQWQSSDRWL